MYYLEVSFEGNPFMVSSPMSVDSEFQAGALGGSDSSWLTAWEVPRVHLPNLLVW